jgi:hypothetical protein
VGHSSGTGKALVVSAAHIDPQLPMVTLDDGGTWRAPAANTFECMEPTRLVEGVPGPKEAKPAQPRCPESPSQRQEPADMGGK